MIATFPPLGWSFFFSRQMIMAAYFDENRSLAFVMICPAFFSTEKESELGGIRACSRRSIIFERVLSLILHNTLLPSNKESNPRPDCSLIKKLVTLELPSNPEIGTRLLRTLPLSSSLPIRSRKMLPSLSVMYKHIAGVSSGLAMWKSVIGFMEGYLLMIRRLGLAEESIIS